MTETEKKIRDIDSPEAAKAFIDECEENFRDYLDETLEKVFEGEIRIAALAGPTCSGKTTTATKLTRRIRRDGKNAVLLSIDDFFIDRNDRNVVDGESPDYDSVKALDIDYFRTFTDRLLDGKKVLIPRYDFPLTSRVGYDEFTPDEKDIYVFEGIQAVYPEITGMFDGGYKSIFISVRSDAEYGGSVLSKHDVRLLRRVVRDYLFRGATAEFTLHLWEGVRDNEEKNIYPNANKCTVYIDSYMPYEPFIIARRALPLLESVPKDSRYRDEAEELIEKLGAFTCPWFEESMIPERSICREFIGK